MKCFGEDANIEDAGDIFRNNTVNPPGIFALKLSFL